MNSNEYILHEIGIAEKEHDPQYKISVKFSGSKHSSRNFDLTKEQLEKIKDIFKDEGVKSPQSVFKLVDELKENQFKEYKFTSWECGLNSTERKNIARVKRVLNALDELNRFNIKDENLFYFCGVLIKDVLSKDYEIKTSNNTYSIKRLKK